MEPRFNQAESKGARLRSLAAEMLGPEADDYIPNPLLSPEANRNRKVLELTKELSSFIDGILTGLNLIYSRLPDVALNDAQEPPQVPTLQEVMQALSDSAQDSTAIDRPVRLRELAGITPEALTVLYEAAVLVIHEGSSEEGVSATSTLVALDPFVNPFWLVHARCLARLGNIDEALSAYQIAISLEPLDPTGYIEGAQLAAEFKQEALLTEILQSGQEVVLAHPEQQQAIDLGRELNALTDALEAAQWEGE